MNRSLVIAQVGAGKYKNTKYVHGDQMPPEGTVIDDPGALGTNTNYSFEAVMKEVLSQNPDQMDLILAATVESYLGSLHDAFSAESIAQTEVHLENTTQDELPEGASCIEDLFEVDKPLDKEQEKTKKVKKIEEDSVKSLYERSLSKNMQRHFNTDIPISVKVTIIENGENSEQLKNNFNSIQDVINDVMKNGSNNWDIFFDITNGFRSFPIYIYTLINYLQKFRGNSVSKGNAMQYHMYYGMYEASKKFLTNSSKEPTVYVTPLVDLQVIDELLQWINAVNEFQNCGSVKQILGILDRCSDWDIPIGRKKEKLSYAFKMFDYGTNSNNLASIERGINLLTNMEDMFSSEEPINDAEKLLIKSISEDFVERFGTEESRSNKPYPYSFLLIQLANWFHEMGREGNAAIAVQETLTTYLMERYPDQSKKFLLLIRMTTSKSKLKNNLVRECNFREERYLFDYDLRQQIKNHLDYIGSTGGKSRKIFSRYKEIKENVRDVMAHIALTDGQTDDYTKYKTTIKNQIDSLLREIAFAEEAAHGKKDLSIGDTLVSNLFYRLMNDDDKRNATKLLEKQKNQLKQIFNDPNNGPDEFNELWDEWELLGEYNLLKQYMFEWTHLGPQMKDEDLAKYFYNKCKKTINGKAGYRRLLNYIDTLNL